MLYYLRLYELDSGSIPSRDRVFFLRYRVQTGPGLIPISYPVGITDAKQNDTYLLMFSGARGELGRCSVPNKTPYSFVFLFVL